MKWRKIDSAIEKYRIDGEKSEKVLLLIEKFDSKTGAPIESVIAGFYNNSDYAERGWYEFYSGMCIDRTHNVLGWMPWPKVPQSIEEWEKE